MNKKNKRGDLPVTILVLGVFVVCTLALFSFLYSSSQVGKFFDGIKILEEANARIEAGNLNFIYLDKKVNKFSPVIEKGSLSLFRERIVFSVEYNP